MPLELIRCEIPCLLHAARCLVHVLWIALTPSLAMYALRFMSCLLAAEAAVAFHKCHFRVRHFGRVYAFPVYKHTSL